MFIEIEGNIYNIDHITHIQREGSRTSIWFVSGNYSVVIESVESIQRKINSI